MHLFAMKLQSIQNLYKEYGKIMKKDLVYYDLLKSMFSDCKLNEYVEAAKTVRPGLTDDDVSMILNSINEVVDSCIQEGKLSDAVHPEKMAQN